ncbi:MAG: hypothetical protein QXK09_01705 [Nitrososphaerota archaeon]
MMEHKSSFENSKFVFFEGDLDIIALIRDCFETLSAYLGEASCGVIAHVVGCRLGERIYKLAIKQRAESLRDANDFLIYALKQLRLSKDAAVFILKPRDDSGLEVLVKVASSGWCGSNDVLFYVLRGIIFQFYRLFTRKPIRILSENRSSVLRSSYEYLVRISKDSGWLADERGV